MTTIFNRTRLGSAILLAFIASARAQRQNVNKHAALF